MTKVIHVQKASGISGSERHLLDLLPALAKRGVECEVGLLGVSGVEDFAEALAARGIDTFVLPAGRDLNPAVARHLARQFRRRRPDLVHTHLIHADLYGQLAARLVGVPGVSSVHSADPFYRKQPYRSAARLAGCLAARTIAISGYVGKMLSDGIIRPERVRVVYYGITASDWASSPAEQTQARAKFGAAEGEMVVGVASRLVPDKGHDTLIRAVAIARRQGHAVRLLVAGSGELRDGLEALARAEDVAGATVFLGFISDVREFMAACDLVAFSTSPRLGEGFGLTALEAQAAARPVVATDVTSLPEIVLHEETGLVVAPDDPEAMAAALVRLATDRPMRERLGSNGQNWAARKFSLEAMVDGTLAVYEEALETGRRRRRAGSVGR